MASETVSETESDRPQAIHTDVRQSSSAAGRGVWWETLVGFWTKINNDWIFNLAGLLAYNFLTALFALLLHLIAGFRVLLQIISPTAEQQLLQRVAAALPGSI